MSGPHAPGRSCQDRTVSTTGPLDPGPLDPGRHGSDRGRRLGVAAALVDGVVVPGDVVVDGTTIGAVGVAPPGRRDLAVPGFVDVQINGFDGVDFTRADPAAITGALVTLARHGVTACVPTLPTAEPAAYEPALRCLATVMDQPPLGAKVLGVHLEGPFLNPARRGAHPEEWLRDPDPALLARWAQLAPLAVLTLAPELDGAPALIAEALRLGIVVSLGHSEATAALAHAAFDAGASMVTHLWNAQPAVGSRQPGLAGVALARPDVRVGIIADLVHVAADTLLLSLAAAGPRAFVVSDALDVAGTAPGTRTRADGRPQHHDGIAVHLDDGTLAGSALPLDAALRNLVALGLDLPRAVDLVTAAPARALGRADVGRLRPGSPADVVVLDDSSTVASVLVDGRQIT